MKNILSKNSIIKSISVITMITIIFTGSFSMPVYAKTAKPKRVSLVSVKLYKNTATIKWKKLSKNCKGYQIYRSTGHGYKRIKTITKRTTTTYKNTSLKEGKYYYKVRAYNKKRGKKKYGKFSKVKSITYKEPIINENTEEPTDTTVSAPTNLRMTAHTNTSITLEWDAVKGADSYNVFGRQGASSRWYKDILIGNTKTNKYTITKDSYGNDLVLHGSYPLAISAVKGTKESEKTAYKYFQTDNKVDKYFSVKENIKLPYSANNGTTTTIYLGQTWTNELKESLASGSAANYEFDRGSLYFDHEDRKIGHKETSYVFDAGNGDNVLDAGEYDNYLVVNVCENQIISWYTNAKIQAVVNSDTIMRGQNKTFDEQYDLVRNTYIVGPVLEPFNKDDYETDGVVISGAVMWNDFNDRSLHICPDDGKTYYETPDFNRWHEKQIGLHLINAYRIMSNRRGHQLNPLMYNKYLDGTEPDGSYILYTGDVTSDLDKLEQNKDRYFYVTNQAFGAQGYVDTVTATKPVNTEISMHSVGLRPAGPCKMMDNFKGTWEDWDGIILTTIPQRASNNSFCVTNLNAASGGIGEAALTSYVVSTGHITWYTADNDKLDCIGIGIKDGYNQVFGGKTY